MQSMGSHADGVQAFVCVECRRFSSHRAPGWRAYRVDELEGDNEPELAFYCPACARREFDAADGNASPRWCGLI
jgi:hypothetical protein